jgi:hypothetical protein
MNTNANNALFRRVDERGGDGKDRPRWEYVLLIEKWLRNGGQDTPETEH